MNGGGGPVGSSPSTVSARYPPLEHIQNPPQPDPKVRTLGFGSGVIGPLGLPPENKSMSLDDGLGLTTWRRQIRV